MNPRIMELDKQAGMTIGQELKIISSGVGRTIEMNERIRELLKQSRRQASEVQTPGSGAYENLVFEKFAELIAKECAQLAMTQHNSTSPDDYDEMEPYQKGCDDTASVISGLIRRNFGVRE